MSPGLAAMYMFSQSGAMLCRDGHHTFVMLLGRLVYNGTMFEASQVKHSYTTISPTAYKHIHAVGAKSDVKNFLVVSDELCFCCKRRYVPDCTCSVDAGCYD